MHIGIDLGGTKIEIVCLDHEGEVCYRQRILSPQHHYSATLAALTSLVNEAEAALSVSATVGVGIPGTIDRDTGKVKNSNSIQINGHPLQQDLQHLLQRPVAVANDANCFALSEATDGIAKNQSVVFGVILGTGCGGGLVVNGQVLAGANGIAGEWGHNPLPFPKIMSNHDRANHFFDQPSRQKQSTIYQHKPLPIYHVDDFTASEYPGPACYCGKRGCLETWLSGTGLSRDYRRLTGEQCDAQEIIRRVEQQQPAALQVFERYCERLAKSLAQIINVIDPDMIVLGGGMSNVQKLYTEVPQRWSRYIFSTTSKTPLRPAMYGDASGVRGAAWLNQLKR